MKVLYAIQGTGNGHLSRARDVIPVLHKNKVDLDILVSGTQADIKIPYPVKYQLNGWSFIFGKKGGVDMWRTYAKTNSLRLQKEIKSIPVSDYDLVINDFEPVSAWACKQKNKECISLSHQAAVLSPKAPEPKKMIAWGNLFSANMPPRQNNMVCTLKIMMKIFSLPSYVKTFETLRVQSAVIIPSIYPRIVMKKF